MFTGTVESAFGRYASRIWQPPRRATTGRINPAVLPAVSCHDGINWATGAGHVGGPAANDSLCYVCHTPVAIDTVYHVTPNATRTNPERPGGCDKLHVMRSAA